MLHLDHIDDVETLRQVARLQDREIERLLARVRELTRELSRLRGDDATTVQKELGLIEQLLARHEEIVRGEAHEPAPSEREKAPRARQPGHGPRPQPELAVVEAVHELGEDERSCSFCGGQVEEMKGQYEESEEVTVIERRFVLVKQKRQKYRCRCNANVVTAPGPPKLQPGGRYSPAFAVGVAASKYLDHLPLERQVRIMGREGLRVDSQTLWDQLNVLAHHLLPTYEALKERVMASPLVFADETPWRMMNGKDARRWWAWGVSCHDAAYYRLLDSRSTEAAASLLADYAGIVMADAYGAYQSLCRDGPSSLVHCWAHVRRKFEELAENHPRECREMLALISRLYDVERALPRWDPNGSEEEQRSVLEERRALREKASRPIVREMHDWILAQHPLPQSDLGKAIRYVAKLWDRLTAFLDDPRIPLDNNAAERSLRGVVVGRKNHYGSRSKRGTEVAAILYTLFESAKLCGVEPKHYVLTATLAAIREPGAVTLPQSLVTTS